MINRYIELRSESPDVITGTVLRYGDLAHIGRTFHERFMPGSVKFDDVVLNLLHDRQQPVARTGAGLELRDSHESLYLRAEFVAHREQFDGSVRVIKNEADSNQSS